MPQTSDIAAEASSPKQKRFLIVVGMPKSGTTFIFSQFSKLTDNFNPPADRKEIDYFRGGASFDHYMEFFKTHDDKVYLDASPLYIDDVLHATDNIKAALAGHKVKILVCIRDPFERIFSHYLHDVAQHHKIIAHADYSFMSPAVMAKYLYPLTERIQALQNAFGVDNVYGFSFAADNATFRREIIDFARLPQDWDFDFSHNPAPGFTSPQVFYNPTHDTALTLKGNIYVLPAGHLIVANRQFSVHRPNINPELGAQIMRNQSSITRFFNTAEFSDAARSRIWQDFDQTAALLQIKPQVETAPRVLYSQISDDLPEHILRHLRCVDSIEDTVARIYDAPMRPSNLAIVASPESAPSLAKSMARFNLANLQQGEEPLTKGQLLEYIVNTFGPIPLYIEATMRSLLNKQKIDEIEALFSPYGGASGLLWPIDAANHLKARNIDLPEALHERLQTIGIRTKFPR
jgi:hypothetical protein